MRRVIPVLCTAVTLARRRLMIHVCRRPFVRIDDWVLFMVLRTFDSCTAIHLLRIVKVPFFPRMVSETSP